LKRRRILSVVLKDRKSLISGVLRDSESLTRSLVNRCQGNCFFYSWMDNQPAYNIDFGMTGNFYSKLILAWLVIS